MERVAVKIELEDDVLAEIDASGMDTSLIAERGLLQALEAVHPEQGRALAIKWRADNLQAIVTHNRCVRERGYPQAQIGYW